MPDSANHLTAIAEAAESVLSRTTYRSMRMDEVAGELRIESGRGRPSGHRGRSGVWLYGEVKAKGVLAALAVAHAWQRWTAERPQQAQPHAHRRAEDARAAVRHAFADVAAFCRKHDFLLGQLRAGLGDTAADRVRGAAAGGSHSAGEHDFGEGHLAVIAREAWHGRSAIFADYLAGHLASATAAFAPPRLPKGAALHLSSVATVACTDDREATPDVLAAGLEGYWFGRYVSSNVPWARSLESAEAVLSRAETSGRAARHRIDAHGALIMELLSTNVLLVRAAEEAGHAERLVAAAIDGPYATGPEGSETRRQLIEVRADLTSRLSLALHRLGRHQESLASIETSLRLSDEALADPSRKARALTNLADTLAAIGRPDEAVEHAEQAVRIRSATTGQSDPTSRERLSLSRNALVRAYAAGGRLDEAVRESRLLLADRALHPRGIHLARLGLADVLFQAGHPTRGALLARQTHLTDTPGYLPFSYAYQHTLLIIARCTLDLERPAEAAALLAASPALDDWFRTTVSPQLAIEIRLCRAEATGEPAELNAVARLADQTLGPAHPTTLQVRRTVARTRLVSGDAEAALRDWNAIRNDEARLAPRHPVRVGTLTGIAEAHAALGQIDRAQAHFAEARAIADGTAADRHPLALAARLGAARLAARIGRTGEAVDLLEQILDRSPAYDRRIGASSDDGAWELPALEDDHPLLRAAHALLAELRPDAVSGLDGAWWTITE
ncbi:tetratricopeptide repeat protein [Micromonospora thermarum]|uniref:Tetratricopeptide repeat protein n=1 Tax=Micromonospora thermarum TaxID=2720024 RepID=A0ABX0ZD08_9ACTN|nr:tetratricopeptide repeat protein [Micromonospora thermarum]NJP33755.1 tetratricopeptide repeat protein [Micromonospora thermarum]